MTVDEQLQRIDGKLDRLLALEPRVAVLENRTEALEKGGLREELGKAMGRIEALEKQAERRQGLTEGVKLAWFLLASAPGAIALLAQLMK